MPAENWVPLGEVPVGVNVRLSCGCICTTRRMFDLDNGNDKGMWAVEWRRVVAKALVCPSHVGHDTVVEHRSTLVDFDAFGYMLERQFKP